MTQKVHVSWFPRTTGTEQEVTLAADATVQDLLDHLDVAPDTVLVVRAGAPIPLDAHLMDGDAVRIVHTVSGGAD